MCSSALHKGQSWHVGDQHTRAGPYAADMSVACNPGTDYVLMGGGQTNPNYLNVADMWSTADGGTDLGGDAPPARSGAAFQDAAMVFMYDNTASQPSAVPQQDSTALCCSTPVSLTRRSTRTPLWIVH